MLLLLVLLSGSVPGAGPGEETVAADGGRRAAAPLRVRATGAISSLDPARAVVSLPPSFGADAVRTGQTASVRIRTAAALRGKVTRVVPNCATGGVAAEIALDDPLPEGAAVGTRIGALIEVGDLRGVLFLAAADLGRP